MLQKENLENFFNSEDGVIKNFNGKIRFCITILIFCGIYVILYLVNQISFYNFLIAFVLSDFLIIFLIVQKVVFKNQEAKDNFFSGGCILILSLLLWYSTVLLLCYQSGQLKYVLLIYCLFWICCSIIVVMGILKNIKLNLYAPDILKQQIKVNKQYNVYLNWTKSTKIMFFALLFIIVLQIIACKILQTVFRSDLYLHILAVACFLLGWMGIFGWKLIIKSILLKKYII